MLPNNFSNFYSLIIYSVSLQQVRHKNWSVHRPLRLSDKALKVDDRTENWEMLD